MTEEQFKTLAGQLRRPHGVMGKMVAEHMNKGNNRMNIETIDHIQPKAYDHILEIGMGNGFYVNNILSRNQHLRYFGVDFSLTMVNESILINDKFVRNYQALFIQAPANDLPFINNFFDSVFTVNTIYFWEDVPLVLSEVRRVLKPDGTFVLSFRPRSIMENLPVTKYGFQIFSSEDVKELLLLNGFTPEKITYKKDSALTFNDQTFDNAFVVVKAKKS